jgi:cytochrome c oxidase subunit III
LCCSPRALPGILWVNTVVLLVSSALIESGRALLGQGRRDGFNICWTAGTACGVLFLGGQALGWRQMSAAGFRLAGSPASAFFYLFTALHAAHVVGGVSALIWVDVKALRFELGPARRTAAQASAVFWHFLDCVWICLLLLLAA